MLPLKKIYLDSKFKESNWKKLVKSTLKKFWQENLQNKAATKTTLKRMVFERPTWDHVAMNTIAVNRARLQARLLTDTITLQCHRAKFYKEEPTCNLCGLEEEDVRHMLLRCPSLSSIRMESKSRAGNGGQN